MHIPRYPNLIIPAILVGLLGNYLATRLPLFLQIWKRTPQHLEILAAQLDTRKHTNAVFSTKAGAAQVKFADRMRNCEDAVMVQERGVVILACDEGREDWNTVMDIFLPNPANGQLFVYDYTQSSGAYDKDALHELRIQGGDFDQAGFHPMGAEYDDATETLFVVSQRYDGAAVELFRVDWATWKATHLRTVQHPLIWTANALALTSSSSFYLTNDHGFPARKYGVLAHLETYLAFPVGSVVHVSLSDTAVTATKVARLSGPNGVALLNDTTLAVASTNTATVRLYAIPHHGTRLVHQRTIPFGYFVDNLSVSRPSGALLVAGHPSFAITPFSKTRSRCNKMTRAEEDADEICNRVERAGTWVSEWTEESGVRHLFVSSGRTFATGCTAVRDEKMGVAVVPGLYERGVLVFGKT